jgi:hypothetical protein
VASGVKNGRLPGYGDDYKDLLLRQAGNNAVVQTDHSLLLMKTRHHFHALRKTKEMPGHHGGQHHRTGSRVMMSQVTVPSGHLISTKEDIFVAFLDKCGFSGIIAAIL